MLQVIAITGFCKLLVESAVPKKKAYLLIYQYNRASDALCPESHKLRLSRHQIGILKLQFRHTVFIVPALLYLAFG